MSNHNLKGMFDRIQRNKVRMGNYETTEKDMHCLRSLLQYPNEAFSVADFCAGSGKALETLSDDSQAVTFGIEPNENKYMELRQRANFALFGGYEECRISRDTFRLMYLNPPYDSDSETASSKLERKEKRFLRQLLQYVSADGILIYNIPRGRMTKDVVTMLVANLDDIRIYQSHDDTYHQVYTIGRKRAEKMINRNEVQRILDLLHEDNELERIPFLEQPLYKVKAGNVTLKLFRSSHMDVEQIVKVSLASSLTKKTMDWTTPKKPSEKLQPLLPDKEMHRVMRMASGKLNGKVGSGELLHVLKGIVKKAIIQSVEETATEQIITDKEVYKITFKTVDRYGTIRTIEG
ncbi:MULTISPECIES: DUF6094 domain-containing protein [Paenibacillus]|uniref:DUF6094 domain-containing protein n=1 Tax=Paenibacillus TaxID=44249 RepID=UPI00042680EB|nr:MULTISPECIES: DUF6094 domain-containing protein [Paenibacillus]KGP77684.1 hypothetical protein P364_0131915 [Paenibacillus sp. MAEPY2]KGP78697.1 hypothetical protein P363_0132005 [Paenibacillus sp. MAEPY1]OZQ61314.1 SAM-dependent methyltransferase [Paenibacillus taichungensis]